MDEWKRTQTVQGWWMSTGMDKECNPSFLHPFLFHSSSISMLPSNGGMEEIMRNGGMEGGWMNPASIPLFSFRSSYLLIESQKNYQCSSMTMRWDEIGCSCCEISFWLFTITLKVWILTMFRFHEFDSAEKENVSDSRKYIFSSMFH